MDTADKEFVTYACFLQQGKIYKILKYSIKYTDLRLIKYAIDACCLIFKSTGQKRYATEMLWLKQLILSKACNPELQQAILSNSLVNTYGKEDSWLEVDLFIEHPNLELKNQLYVHKNSTFDVNTLFRVTALTGLYIAKLCSSIEPVISKHINSEHTVYSTAKDIHSLAYQLSQKSLLSQILGCKHGFKPPDLYVDAQHTLEDSIKQFNATVVCLPRNQLESVVDSIITSTDVEADNTVAALRVSLTFLELFR